MPKYQATAYIRLSYTDDRSSESDSVTNQRKLIENFIERNPDIQIVSEKIDDGYSGIIFDRPAFKEMMQDITDGRINCVIVKDLSRLGREYIETGRYLRRVFPTYGVRFIAITDNIDTAHEGSGDDLTVSVKNIMNEAYCRDISIKTRTSLDIKRRNGDFVGAFPVYGYMKSEENKNLLVPDPYASRVVQDIFRMRLDGTSALRIATVLNEMGILSPLAYKKNNGFPYAPNQFLSFDTLKSLLLPLVLLVFNLPVVYGLALYNTYEQIFIRIKGSKSEQKKMKWQVIRFSGINLSKVSAIRKSLPNTIVCCRTSNDLQINLKKLARRLDLQIGENYMKRSRYYVLACIAGLILSFIGLIGANSDVSLKDLVTLNFVFDIPRIKEILTNIFSTMIVFSATLFFFAIGFAKKQREDVSQIKKYALYELLLSVKMQHSQLVDYPPIDEPADLFCAYVHNVYEVRAACDKVLAAYENLLTTWEQETLKNLQHSAMVLSEDFGISAENFREYSATQFCNFYDEKVRTAPQNEKINVFTHKIKTDIEKYSKHIEQFCEDFKHYY